MTKKGGTKPAWARLMKCYIEVMLSTAEMGLQGGRGLVQGGLVSAGVLS